LTQHSEDQNELASGVNEPILTAVQSQAPVKELKVFGLPGSMVDKILIGAMFLSNALIIWTSWRVEIVRHPWPIVFRLGMLLVLVYIWTMVKPHTSNEVVYAEQFTSDASELPRLLKKAHVVKVMPSHEEDSMVGVWSSLSYHSKKIGPQDRAELTDEAKSDLKGLLSSETRRDRLESLVRIAAIAADPELLPLLRDLKDRTKDLDVLDNLRVALRDAISSCAKSA
jgi:hypothetical protein